MRARDRLVTWVCAHARLSRRAYYADFFITVPVTVALCAHSAHHHFGAWWCVMLALGWVAWTLYEYAVHRFVSHRVWGLRDMHWLHHRSQRDYIALPPWATIAMYAFFAVAFGVRSSAFSVGFSVGYVIYAALHTAFHYARIGDRHPLRGAKQRHVLHHRHHDVCYGITHGWWDRLLGTEHQPNHGI